MCVCVFVCTSASMCVYPCETVFHWSRICLQKHDLLFAHEWIIMCLYAKVRLHRLEHYMLRIFHSYCICLCAMHFHRCDTCMWMYACTVCGWVEVIEICLSWIAFVRQECIQSNVRWVLALNPSPLISVCSLFTLLSYDSDLICGGCCYYLNLTYINIEISLQHIHF